MAFEGVEVPQRRRPEDRWTEVQIGGRENGVVVLAVAVRHEAIDEVGKGRHPKAGEKVVVQGGHRHAMQHGVVSETRISGDRASAGDLQVQPPCGRLDRTGLRCRGAKRGGQTPRGTRRRIGFAHVGDLHRRRV